MKRIYKIGLNFLESAMKGTMFFYWPFSTSEEKDEMIKILITPIKEDSKLEEYCQN